MEIGQKAPDFALYDTDKSKLSLSSLEGKNVVILFFPLAFTSVCTREMCYVRDNITLFNNANAVMLGISVDSLFTLKKYKEEQGLNFSLLSDFNREASKAYGVLYDVFPSFEMQGVSKRAVFVIDKAGDIQYVEICPTPQDFPNFEAIQATLETLNK